MTFLEEMDKRLERTGHTLDTWSPGDAMGTRYRICAKGHDYDSAPRTACTALGRKSAELMVTAFVTGWGEAHVAVEAMREQRDAAVSLSNQAVGEMQQLWKNQ